MHNLAGFHALNSIHQRWEQRSVIFHSVPLDVDNYDSESNLLKIVLVLKTLVGRDQNVTLALGLGDQLSVWESTPFGFRNGQDFMIQESLPQTRIGALV
jgi:hypothetical protein